MAFRALLAPPRAANPCGADASRVVSAASRGAGTNPLTSFLSSVSTDPLRTRQLLEGYDVTGAASSAPPSLPDAFVNAFLAQDFGENDVGVPGGKPVVSASFEAAWAHTQSGENGETVSRPHGTAPFSRPAHGLESFQGLAGPEAIGRQMSSNPHELVDAGTGLTTIPESPFLSDQALLRSAPDYPEPFSDGLSSFAASAPASSSVHPARFSQGPSTISSVSPQLQEPSFESFASPFQAQAPASWLEEFQAFSQGRSSNSGEAPLKWAQEFATATPQQGSAVEAVKGRQETAGEPSLDPGSGAADRVGGPRSVSFAPLSPFLSFPHPPPQVPLVDAVGHRWNFADTEGCPEARSRAMEAALRAQRTVGIRSTSAAEQEAKESAVEREPAKATGVSFDAEAAREMLETLKAMGEEKLESSEFVFFIRQLASGELSLVDGQLVDSSGAQVDWDSLVKATKGATFGEQEKRVTEEKSETKTGTERARERDGEKEAFDENVDECASFEQSMKDLEEAWVKAREKGEIDDEELSLFRSIFNTAELSKALGDSSADEASLMEGLWPSVDREQRGKEEAASLPVFSADNPYLSEPSPLALAQLLLEEGKLQEAVRALEAEVQRNPNSSEGWRLLGEALADCEQDADAIVCLKKGHEVDPYNLDSLLALGVSLTNELDAPQALRNLRDWLANHDEFSALPGVQRALPEDFEELKRQVAALFHEAAAWREHAAGDVHMALGVIHNIDQNFDRALYHFAEALKFASGRKAATLWNKIGATLANSGRSEAALLAYEQTLALRPNYPRAWTNLGVAHSNLGDTERAMRFYLTALVLNPAASHLWYYVRSATISLGKFDWLGLAENRDLEGLRALLPAGAVPTRGEILEKGVGKVPQEDSTVLHRLLGMIKNV
ncbi:tetratricopeptide repeat-containing protein [Toxoplasma gondii GAB2-2007-GAL-DOM2]|uniref:Tetratricopeptide repeat-containing protein n=4 Tax=Toxoplasma gondii TaxID=5811 RepID=S7WJ28_TOXGG|nr:tetratricopeptide repeat-containing protein [Toxoplasma gondii GT1]KAF4641783.1 tetratricopeptide repeat-containing protein [Toxoplasma gondii]KFG48566.1 tetratricopeptide repeat-containing protein [Toxoplasma gondii GAB2-2007-GAL-DOM2]